MKNNKGRTSFYSKINDYVGQVIQYSEYFEDQKNRDLFKDKHSLDIQKKVDTIIVAGQDEGLDKKQLHDEVRRRTNHLDIITFNDVLNRLIFCHTQQFGDASSYGTG